MNQALGLNGMPIVRRPQPVPQISTRSLIERMHMNILRELLLGQDM